MGKVFKKSDYYKNVSIIYGIVAIILWVLFYFDEIKGIEYPIVFNILQFIFGGLHFYYKKREPTL
jgi:hypothetical protein